MKRQFHSVLNWPVRRFNLTGRTAVVAGPFVWLLLFFSGAVSAGREDQLCRFAARHSAVYRAHEFRGRRDQSQARSVACAFLVTDSLYFATYVNSVVVAAISTLLCLLIGYPMAYYIARSNPARRNLLMMAVMLPFWTSFLIRVYAWIGILKNNGLLNNFLMSIGLIHSPIELYHTNIGGLYRHGVFVSAVSRDAACTRTS